MIEEHHRDQRNRQDEAGGDAIAQLIPDREEGDLVPKALALNIAAEQLIGQNRDQRTEEDFKHD